MSEWPPRRNQIEMSVTSEVWTYVGVFGFFFFFLRQLLRSAQKKIDKPHPLPKYDDFIKFNGEC